MYRQKIHSPQRHCYSNATEAVTHPAPFNRKKKKKSLQEQGEREGEKRWKHIKMPECK